MSGKYSSSSTQSSPSYSSMSIDDFEGRYDVQTGPERKMVSDNLARLGREMRLIQSGLDEIYDAMAGQSKQRYQELEEDFDSGVEDLNRVERAIQLHYELEDTLTDMMEMEEAFRSESLPINRVLDTMDTLNDRRNNLKDQIEDTGYEFW